MRRRGKKLFFYLFWDREPLYVYSRRKSVVLDDVEDCQGRIDRQTFRLLERRRSRASCLRHRREGNGKAKEYSLSRSFFVFEIILHRRHVPPRGLQSSNPVTCSTHFQAVTFESKTMLTPE